MSAMEDAAKNTDPLPPDVPEAAPSEETPPEDILDAILSEATPSEEAMPMEEPPAEAMPMEEPPAEAILSEDAPPEEPVLEAAPILSEAVDPTATDAAPLESPLAATIETMPVPVPEEPDLPMIRQEDLKTSAPASDTPDRANSRVCQVPVEPLGAGIVNALADAVDQVVGVASTVRKKTPPKKSPGKKKKPFFSMPPIKPPASVGKGMQRFMSGAGGIAQNGINIVTGLAGCLQESFRCMGKVIMNPSPKARPGQPPPESKSLPPVLTHTPVTQPAK